MASFEQKNPAPVQDPISKLDTSSVSSIQKGMLSIIPDGHFKNELVNFWKNPNPITGIQGIINLFKGRKYTTGEYILGERMMDQVLGMNVGRASVSDEMVDLAKDFLTMIFGVRLNATEDLDALDKGVEAYSKRPVASDANPDAIRRAVYLKQNFYPISTYNRSVWDLSHVKNTPLVAPIPSPKYADRGKYYTGPLPGGGEAVNGIVMASTMVETDDNVLDPETGQKAGDIKPKSIMAGTSWLIMGLVVLGVLGWWVFGRKKK